MLKMTNGLTLATKFQLCATAASDFFGCKVILGADYHTKVYNCAHFWTPGYFRPRITVEMATTERIGRYLDFEIVQSFPLEQNSKLSD